MQALLQDVRYAARSLGTSPGFAAVVVMTLALGIGANTALFSVFNAVLLRPLPYPESHRLVVLWETRLDEQGRRSRGTAANILDWQAQNEVFDSLAMFSAAGGNLTGDGEPEQGLGARVSQDYFRVLGVEPILGRTFRPDDHVAGANRVVVLHHDLWQRRYGGRSDIVGTTIRLDDTPHTVIGVMPPGIYPTWPATQAYIPFLPRYQQLWLPIARPPEQALSRTSHVFGTIARLRPGVTLEAAQANMQAIAARLAQQYPAANREEGVVVVPLVDEVVGDVRAAMLILVGAVGLVMLVACANLAGLMVARSIARRREIAIRAALGAGPGRLARLLTAESVLLAALGGAAGLALASLGIGALTALTPQDIPRLDAVGIDASVLTFTVSMTALTAVLIGLASVGRAGHTDLSQSLSAGGRASVSKGADAVRQLLVTLEIGVAALLMVGAALLLESLWNLQRVDLGFDPDRTLTFELSLPESTYREAHQILGFQDAVVERVGGMAGVQSVAFAYDHPLDATWGDWFEIDGRPRPEPGRELSAWLRPVSPEYFDATGVAVLRGRALASTDDLEHPGAVVVNEAFVRRFFPGEDPLGRRLRLQRHWRFETPVLFEIVGIVRDVRFLGPAAEPAPAYYRPYKQFPEAFMDVLVRTEADPLSHVEAIREAIWSIDPELPIGATTTMASHYANVLAQPRFNMLLLSLFAGFTLLLASMGVYGLLSYHVAQRRREIGLRMALGARLDDVTRMVVAQGLWLAGAGVVGGLAAAALVTRVLESLLFDVRPIDAPTYGLVGGGLLVIALAASYLPARRAASVDPMLALRAE